MKLLFQGTFQPQPKADRSVHEVQFSKAVHVKSFRVVKENDVAHPGLVGAQNAPFRGETPPAASLTIELFGAERGHASLCTALLDAPHRHASAAGAPPSALVQIGDAGAAVRCTYLVVRCDSVPVSLCLYGDEAGTTPADGAPPPPPPPWEAQPGHRDVVAALERDAPSRAPLMPEADEATRPFGAAPALLLRLEVEHSARQLAVADDDAAAAAPAAAAAAATLGS